MLLAELAGDCLAEGAAGTNEEDLHGRSLRKGVSAVCALTMVLGKRRMIRRFLTRD